MRFNVDRKPIQEFKDLVKVQLETYVPSKYLIIDTETGDMWQHDGITFRRATGDLIDAGLTVIGNDTIFNREELDNDNS